MQYSINEQVVSLIVRNLDDQLNVKKMEFIALQKEISDLEVLKASILNSEKNG